MVVKVHLDGFVAEAEDEGVPRAQPLLHVDHRLRCIMQMLGPLSSWRG